MKPGPYYFFFQFYSVLCKSFVFSFSVSISTFTSVLPPPPMQAAPVRLPLSRYPDLLTHHHPLAQQRLKAQVTAAMIRYRRSVCLISLCGGSTFFFIKTVVMGDPKDTLVQ